MNDWTGYDYLAARLERQPQGYLLTAQQRGELRRYLLRALPPATFNPGQTGHGDAIRAAIAQAVREKVLADVTLSPDPSTVGRLYAETVGLGPLDALLQIKLAQGFHLAAKRDRVAILLNGPRSLINHNIVLWNGVGFSQRSSCGADIRNLVPVPVLVAAFPVCFLDVAELAEFHHRLGRMTKLAR